MDLVEIAPPDFAVDLDLAYAGAGNFTGAAVYGRAACYLHRDAAAALTRACRAAAAAGLGLRIFDAYRPTKAQWVLWNPTPDTEFLADPRKGSPHSRGVAVDLTLLDPDGDALPMGTPFDAFTPLSHHGNDGVDRQARANRLLLLGLMTEAGWGFYRNEWWHYQLFNSRDFPLISDAELPVSMM